LAWRIGPDTQQGCAKPFRRPRPHGPAIHTTSFGPKGAVLTHLITQHAPDITAASRG
jgi:hypothetical protein